MFPVNCAIHALILADSILWAKWLGDPVSYWGDAMQSPPLYRDVRT